MHVLINCHDTFGECFGDVSFGAIVLANKAFCVNTRECVDDGPCPFGYLGRRDSAGKHVEKQACLQSYGWQASGDACSTEVSPTRHAAIRARR